MQPQGKDLKAGALTIQKENMDSKTVAPHAIGVCSMVDVVWYGWYSSSMARLFTEVLVVVVVVVSTDL